MPFQAQLFVGVPVWTTAEVRAWWKHFKKKPPKDDDDLFGDLTKKTIRHDGRVFEVQVEAHHEHEGGSEFPPEPGSHSNDAAVGFFLTDRYDGAVLDYKHEGRPEPFAIDLRACEKIVKQARRFLPGARLLIWEQFY